MATVVGHLGSILAGFGVTVWLGTLAFLGAMVVGTIIAVCRMSPIRPLRGFGTTYVEVFRNAPLFVVMALFVSALPDVGILLDTSVAITLALVLFGGAYAAEVVRSGMLSVSTGQVEASRALGLGFGTTVLQVVVPQALRTMISPIASIYVGLIIGTSLGGQLAVPEVMSVILQIQNAEAIGWQLLVAVAVLYVATAFLILGVARVLEWRLRVLR